MKLFFFFILGSISVFSQSANDEIVPIKELIHNIQIDLKYNTVDNLTYQKLYTTDEAFLAHGTIKRLIVVQDSLKNITSHNGNSYPQGLGLKIYDGYRPRAVQYLMWEFVQAPYVADPNTGSVHNRGGAVDLSIIDLSTGIELQMPTKFDFFGPEAGHNYQNLPPHVIANRTLLYNMMVNVAGFVPYSVEWWHYHYSPSTSYPLLDFQMK